MWIKKGVIFEGDKKYQTPVAFDINLNNDDFLRIYYAARNKKNQSEIKYFEINLKEPKKLYLR